MKYINHVHFCCVCLVVGSLTSVGAEAGGFSFSYSKSSSKHSYTTNNRPWGNLEDFKPGLRSDPPPAPAAMVPNSHYLGAAPGTGWYAAQVPVTSSAPSSSEPVVEVETSGAMFYEQQNIVYTVRVVSSDNLKTLTPIIPSIKGAILEQVDGPVATTRNSRRDNSREIVNEYHFKLTPLRPGEIVIPAIKFSGTHVANRQWNGAPGMPANAGENSFTIASDGPLTLQVMPADPAVTPWLPLNDLRLRMQLTDTAPAREGVPVTLTLELTARGALGTQLPSLEPQLKSDEFRAYRDSVTTSNGVSKDGTKFLGTRKETYTLIPLQDGWIHLPGIQVAWWDVDRDKPMLAGLPGQDAVASAVANRSAVTTSGEQDMFPIYFWTPLLIILGLVVGYWLGAWARTRPILHAAGSKAGAWLSATGQRAVQHTVAAGRKLSPMPYVDSLRMAFASVMPQRVKLWLCVRCLDREDRPEAWCCEFRSRICKHLDISRHAPISAIAEKIIEIQPPAEPARLRALVQSMDNALYGSGPLDFAVWKNDFRQQLRPRLFQRSRRSALRRARRSLPALNPHVA
ncbi:MAG: hypothetical protein LJE75_08605 [Gammaproteobacteria bacterium]|nr:hypothetical protein [Gammaproteobacteria bacterium]